MLIKIPEARVKRLDGPNRSWALSNGLGGEAIGLRGPIDEVNLFFFEQV
jgi:hypothetical protein